MPSLNRNEKITCEKCDTQATELNFARHKKNFQFGLCIEPSVLFILQKSEKI